MARGALMLNRPQMLRALPKHVAFAALSGAIAGFILYFLNQIALEGQWNLLMAIPIGAVYVNAAMIPLAIPGRHWSFAFIGAMLMFLLLVAGMIIAPKFPFPHAWAQHPDLPPTLLTKVNSIAWAGILSGGCIGVYYGVLAGSRESIVSGLILGATLGFVMGFQAIYLVVDRISSGVTAGFDEWRFNSPLHFAWQLAAAMALLHLGACLGAAMGAGPAPASPQSEIRNLK